MWLSAHMPSSNMSSARQLRVARLTALYNDSMSFARNICGRKRRSQTERLPCVRSWPNGTRRGSAFRTLDTLHVASALELKAEHFWTFDDRQAKLALAVGLKTR